MLLLLISFLSWIPILYVVILIISIITIISIICFSILVLPLYIAFLVTFFIISILKFFSKKWKINIVNGFIIAIIAIIIKQYICLFFGIDFLDFRTNPFIGIPMIALMQFIGPRVKYFVQDIEKDNLSSDLDYLTTFLILLLLLEIIKITLLIFIKILLLIFII